MVVMEFLLGAPWRTLRRYLLVPFLIKRRASTDRKNGLNNSTDVNVLEIFDRRSLILRIDLDNEKLVAGIRSVSRVSAKPSTAPRCLLCHTASPPRYC